MKKAGSFYNFEKLGIQTVWIKVGSEEAMSQLEEIVDGLVERDPQGKVESACGKSS